MKERRKVAIFRIVLPGEEHIFRKNMKKLSGSEKWSRKTLAGKCDGYMWGLGGAKKRKCWFFIGFTITFLKCQGEPGGVNRTNRQARNGVWEGVGGG